MNDYTLEQINGKLTVTNQWLDTIYSQNEDMIQNQYVLISGDKEIIENQKYIGNILMVNNTLLMILILFILLMRCLR